MSFTGTGVEVNSNGGSLGGLSVSRMFLMKEKNQGSSTSAANNLCRWASAPCGSFVAPGNAIGSWCAAMFSLLRLGCPQYGLQSIDVTRLCKGCSRYLQ